MIKFFHSRWSLRSERARKHNKQNKTTLQTVLVGSERAAFCHCPVSSCPGSLLPEDDTKLKKKKKKKKKDAPQSSTCALPMYLLPPFRAFCTSTMNVKSPVRLFLFPGSRCRTGWGTPMCMCVSVYVYVCVCVCVCVWVWVCVCRLSKMKVYCGVRKILRTGKGEHLPLSPSADIERSGLVGTASAASSFCWGRCVFLGE